MNILHFMSPSPSRVNNLLEGTIGQHLNASTLWAFQLQSILDRDASKMCRGYKPKLFLPPCPPGGWSHHIRDSRLDPDWNVSPGFIECHEPPWWCTHQAITLQEWTQNIEALLFIPKLSSFDPRSQLMGDFNTLSPLLPGITMCERL